jgi:hypothetical protein
MATAHEIRELIAQTTTGAHRRHVPREVRGQVRRYAERRREEEPLREATLRAVRNPGTVTLARHLKSLESL